MTDPTTTTIRLRMLISGDFDKDVLTLDGRLINVNPMLNKTEPNRTSINGTSVNFMTSLKVM
jgi:hypothetical protein